MNEQKAEIMNEVSETLVKNCTLYFQMFGDVPVKANEIHYCNSVIKNSDDWMAEVALTHVFERCDVALPDSLRCPDVFDALFLALH